MMASIFCKSIINGSGRDLLLTATSKHCVRSIATRHSSSLVSWEVDEETKIGTITLQSPETYNALTVEMGNDFRNLVQSLTADLRMHDDDDDDGGGGGNSLAKKNKHVNVILLQSQGDNAFSAGGNFPWLKSLRHNSVHKNYDLMMHFYNSFLCIRKVPVPVVCALQGAAMGAGCCLALACDLRVAAKKPAILGFPFSKLGIHSGMGGSWLLRQALGSQAKANEILLTGQTLSGQEALELGLVNRVADNAKEEALQLAKQVARQHPVAIRSMIQTLRIADDQGLEAVLQREALAQAMCYNRNDWGEGLDAIAEKRDPIFDDYYKS
jgi:enoyl-CoA hydratase/carnithine racemase